jgi:hypothetical protein
VRLDEALDEREPEAQPAVRARRRHVRLPEALEDVRQEFGRDALALVFHLDARRAVLPADAHAHAPALARELDGVVQEVPEDLHQTRAVAVDDGRL